MQELSTRIAIDPNFSNVNGVPRNNLAKLNLADGTLDQTWNPSADSDVQALTLDGNGYLFAGGKFQNAGGASHPYIAKINVVNQGEVDPVWNPAIAGTTYDTGVLALALDPSGSLLVGGRFDAVGGVPHANLAKVSLTDTGGVEAASHPQIARGFYTAAVQALAVPSNDTLIIGGQLAGVGRATRWGIAALSLDSIFSDEFE